MNGKLTELDRQKWCKEHSCKKCKYMDGYCHIREDMYKECFYCEKDYSCSRCSWGKNHSQLKN